MREYAIFSEALAVIGNHYDMRVEAGFVVLQPNAQSIELSVHEAHILGVEAPGLSQCFAHPLGAAFDTLDDVNHVDRALARIAVRGVWVEVVEPEELIPVTAGIQHRQRVIRSRIRQ